jgi:hypothetical protein
VRNRQNSKLTGAEHESGFSVALVMEGDVCFQCSVAKHIDAKTLPGARQMPVLVRDGGNEAITVMAP